MVDPDPHDNTSTDYKQFERALLVQDRDVAGVDTADIDDATARNLVSNLVDADVVTPVPGARVLVHEPSAPRSIRRRSWPSSTGAGRPAAMPIAQTSEHCGPRRLVSNWRHAFDGSRRGS